MKSVVLALLFSITLTSKSNAEPRFEVLFSQNGDADNSVLGRSLGDLITVAAQSVAPVNPDQAAVAAEVAGYYASGDLGLVNEYKSGVIRSVSNNTGFLDILVAANGFKPCTATAITEDLILTNSHCVLRDGPERAVRAIFFIGYEVRDPNVLGQLEGIGVELPAIEQNDELDYAVLRLSKAIPNFVPLQIRKPRDPGLGEKLTIIGFPNQNPLSAAFNNCLASPEATAGVQFVHFCRTYYGNSGSLIYADDWSLVGLHHKGEYRCLDQEIDEAGPDESCSRWQKLEVNYGIRISEILEESQLLTSILVPYASDFRSDNLSEQPISQNLPTMTGNDPIAREMNLKLSEEQRRDVQLRLDVLGFEVGALDGVWGEKTRAAIRWWQLSNSVGDASTFGYLDEKQLALLLQQSDEPLRKMRESERSVEVRQSTSSPPPPKVNVGRVERDGCMYNSDGSVVIGYNPSKGC